MIWQPIETAPKDGTWFLGYWPQCAFEDRIITTQWHDFGFDDRPYWLDAPDNRDWTEPTHWMPLPTPPQEDQ